MSSSMSSRTFVIRSLVYHWRINLAVALGVAAATAVLTGALLVGDSVRGSLRQLTLERLGRIDEVLVGDRFFRQELAEELAAAEGFERYFSAAEPALLFPRGTVETVSEGGAGSSEQEDASWRAAGVLVLGTLPDFWQLGDAEGRPTRPPGDDEIVLNEPLAAELQVRVGDLVSLRLPSATQVPAETILGEKRGRIRGIARLRVVDIIPARGLGRFSLQSQQTSPRNAYVALSTLQNPLDQEGRANCLLVAGKPGTVRPDPRASQALAEMFQPKLTDYGFQLKRARQQFPADDPDGQVVFDYFSLSTDRMLFSPQAEALAESAYRNREAQPVLTYLANAIGKQADQSPASGEDQQEPVTIPYSTIAAVSDATARQLFASLEQPPLPLGPEDIVLNSWAAERLGAQPGDTITVTYFEPETTHGEYVEKTVPFVLRAIVPLTTPARPFTRRREAEYDQPPTPVNDPDLTPEVAGVTDRDSIERWDVPFPMTRAIEPEDDTYWKNHRTTPKAFVSLERGQQLWGTPRFGKVTSFRIPAGEGTTQEDLARQFEREVHATDARLGLVFQPMKRRALEASAGATPFDGLFLGLSLFIIAAALMLVSLLFRLGVEQRARELGTLLALGLRRRQATWLLVWEGTIVAALGALAGVVAGVVYCWLMLVGLHYWWVGAIVTPFLEFHWKPLTLVLGYLLGTLVSAVTIALTVRGLRKVSNRRLLAGQTQESGGLVRRSTWPAALGGAGLLLASVGIGAAAQGVGGETQAGLFVGAGCLLLIGLLLLVWSWLRGSRVGSAVRGGWPTLKLAGRSAGRNPGRSVLTIGLIAFASFLIVAMSAFRLSPTSSGVGGFNLLAESGQPIFDDLGTVEGRRGLLGSDAELLDESTILPLRVRPGDDASCNNLYRASQPRILAVSEQMVRHFDDPRVPQFDWAATAAGDEAAAANPWRLLQDADAGDADAGEADAGEAGAEEAGAEEVIPVILDKDTAMWSLRLYWGVGEEFDVTYEDGTRLRFRVVGLLSKSVLQGSLLIGESQFVRRFPDVAGDRFFLIRTPPDQADPVTRLLESRLGDEGFDVRSSYRILEGLLAVQNTYLSTFQSLGALGLLLGTFGLATVQLRSVLERRGELALLRTTGFRRRRLAWMVLLENALLLLGGLATGVVAALVAVIPHMLSGAAAVPWSLLRDLLALLGVVLVVGLCSGLAAVRATLKAPLLDALRHE